MMVTDFSSEKIHLLNKYICVCVREGGRGRERKRGRERGGGREREKKKEEDEEEERREEKRREEKRREEKRMWISKTNLEESVVSSHAHVGSCDETQVTRLACKPLYLLSHLAGTKFPFLCSETRVWEQRYDYVKTPYATQNPLHVLFLKHLLL
jgi:hypothetical protein